MFKQFLYYLLVFLLGALAGFLFLKYDIVYKILKPQIPPQEITQKTENKFLLTKKVSAGLIWWNQDNGFASLKENKDKISSINPVWYYLKENAKIEKFTGAENKEIINFVKRNNIKIIPVISNENDPFYVKQIIQNEELTNKHIADIVNLVERFDYDGIEIDYQNINVESDFQNFSNLIGKLSDQLGERGKILAIVVYPKTSELGELRILADKANQFKIMTEKEEVLASATKIIEPKRIFLGIHFYGYEQQGNMVKDLTYQDVLGLINRFNPEIKTSPEQEKYFEYKKDDQSQTVYFEDHETIEKEIGLVKKYNIAGIAIRYLGQEDPKNWQVIESNFSHL
jgi:spore germination protein YaaH